MQNGCIGFQYIVFGPGPTFSPSGPTAGTNNVNFQGTDTTPGTTYPNPVTIASGTATNQGQFTQSGSTLQVGTGLNAKPGSYTGHLQYTITG